MTTDSAEKKDGAGTSGTTSRGDSASGEAGESKIAKAGRVEFALPCGKLFGVVIASAVVVGGVAAGFSATLWTTGLWGVILGAVSTAVGSGIGVASIKPWAPREGRKWGLAMLRANGIGLLATLVVGGLLYSATPINAGAMGLSVPLVFIATWVSVAKVLEGVFRDRGLAG